MIDPTLQRSALTLASIALACAVYKWLPTAPDWITEAIKGVLLVTAGGMLGKAHLEKPGSSPDVVVEKP